MKKLRKHKNGFISNSFSKNEDTIISGLMSMFYIKSFGQFSIILFPDNRKIVGNALRMDNEIGKAR